MVWLRSCPRCDRGDLDELRDQGVRMARCLQCGHVVYDVTALGQPTRERPTLRVGRPTVRARQMPLLDDGIARLPAA